MKKSLQEILELLPALVEDVKKAEEKLDNQQYSRRVYVRALFAMIEGTIYAMKIALFGIAHSSSNSNKLKVPDLVVLKGSSFDLDDKGEVQEKEKYFRISDNLKFTVKLVNRLLLSSIDLGVGTQNWMHFVRTVKIRNKVTHPKNLNDLSISDKDLDCIRSVNSWFNEIIKLMMASLKKFFCGNGVNIGLQKRKE
jgi:hypothetical protein